VPRLSTDEFYRAFSYNFRWLFYLQAVNLLYNLIKIDMLEKATVIKSLLLSGVFLSLAGFIQLMVLPDFTVLDPALGWDPHKNRLASTFFDPNFTGGYLSLVLIYIFLMKDELTTKFFQKKSLRFFFLLILAAIFLTYSRSTWGMLGIAILLYGWKHSGKIVLLAIFVAFLAYFAVPRIQTRVSGITDPADSAHFRLISWKNTLDIAKDNLVMGVGYNAFKQAQIEYGYLAPDARKEHSATGSDSSILLVLATTGVFGFVIFFVGYFLPFLSKKRWHYAVFLLPLFLQTQFINALFYPQIMFLWLLALVTIETNPNPLRSAH
jgi:O-antigen ligase